MSPALDAVKRCASSIVRHYVFISTRSQVVSQPLKTSRRHPIKDLTARVGVRIQPNGSIAHRHQGSLRERTTPAQGAIIWRIRLIQGQSASSARRSTMQNIGRLSDTDLRVI